MRFVKAMAIALGIVLSMPTVIYAEDIDDMTMDELKEAYQQLEEENQELQDQVKDLKAQLYDAQNSEETDSETTTEEDTVEEEAVLMTTEDFLKDIVESYNTRSIVATRYTISEEAMLSEAEEVDYLLECAESERPLYEKYHNAVFEDLNIQYLCNQYIKGLDKQLQIKAKYEKSEDFDSAYSYFESGYYNRAYVIVELAEYYECPFGDISEMKEMTAALDSFNEAETRNASVDATKIKETQELLNGIGFFCGTADGVSGKRTVKSIKRFQEMYGYEPSDGMIDDELIEQLKTVYEEKVPVDTENIEDIVEETEG